MTRGAAALWLCGLVAACSPAHQSAAPTHPTDSVLRKLPGGCPPRPARVSRQRWERPESCAAILEPPAQPSESEESWQRLMNERRLACNLDEELRGFVAARQGCAADADCALLFSPCVFRCDIPVTASRADEVEAKLKELKDRYKAQGFSCTHECRRATAVACDQGSCVDATPECVEE
ncbi:MAG TPA: hypothetical protein VMT03_25200 [Polyangia bacterium]|nr:hypothetical protein [Polyangia bacterium]